MRHTSARPADRIEKAVYKYGDKLFRICLITLGNTSDAEDAVQETMIKYLQKAPDFENNEHEKTMKYQSKSRCCILTKSRIPHLMNLE